MQLSRAARRRYGQSKLKPDAVCFLSGFILSKKLLLSLSETDQLLRPYLDQVHATITCREIRNRLFVRTLEWVQRLVLRFNGMVQNDKLAKCSLF